jgi:uncharacterized protein (TIGR00156 family)
MKGKLALTLGVLLAAGFVLTACATGGGYKGAAQVRTVAEAKNSPDDTPVQLRGKIERRFSGDKYLFSDDTGSITAEINFWVWRGLSVDENDTVEITGEVDVNGDREKVHELDVERITKL